MIAVSQVIPSTHLTRLCNEIRNLQYNGICNLRFDDTNPEKENIDYVNSIIKDVKWLGFNCEKNILYASDYFEQMHEYAIQLIKAGLAYVDDQSTEEGYRTAPP